MNSLLFNSAKSCCPTPRKRYRKPKLKVMNEDISGAIAMKKKAFYQWKINGRSEDPRNELYIQKKETTYNLRKHCRKAVAMNRIDEREKIMEANIKNKNSFYRLIKKQRGRLSNHIDELSVGDTVYSTENNILSGWKHHFENLTKNSIHEHFDNKYQKRRISQEWLELNDQTIITMLEAITIFNAVTHVRLGRRLYQMKIPVQSILIIDNLYKNVVLALNGIIKYRTLFRIEQGVRQGGTLSADLYKNLYKYTLDILADSGYGEELDRFLVVLYLRDDFTFFILPIMFYGLEIIIIICEGKYSFTPDVFKAATKQKRQTKDPVTIAHLKEKDEIISSDKFSKKAAITTGLGMKAVSTYLGKHLAELDIQADIIIDVDSEAVYGQCECEDSDKCTCPLFTTPVRTVFTQEPGIVSSLLQFKEINESGAKRFKCTINVDQYVKLYWKLYYPKNVEQEKLTLRKCANI
ncbi:unnamed protein product [Mytilus edulis]|uniref:Uncharacterized protein n=1 Tax=Mytilus edulis TaxID=6550 RepID=A0A8S3QGQ8_MYTED|nr:unnamed protein product [Mytilus edulis]